MDEPNSEMYSSIRSKIASYGKEAIPLLEDAWLNAKDLGDVKRIENLIDDIRFSDLYFELKNWYEFHSNDLVEALLLLTTFRYPDLDVEKYRDSVYRLRQNIWLEINQDLTALEKVKVLNHIFYDVYKFRGEITSADQPQRLLSEQSYRFQKRQRHRTGHALHCHRAKH